MKSYKNNFEELRGITLTSGLYYFYDGNDSILYIGKASVLRSRVLSHYHNHSLYREMVFFVKILNSKGLSIRNKEKLPKELLDIWDDFKDREFSNPKMLVIDFILNRVKRIDIEVMSSELTELKEKEMIEKYEPPFNFETACAEYFEIR